MWVYRYTHFAYTYICYAALIDWLYYYIISARTQRTVSRPANVMKFHQITSHFGFYEWVWQNLAYTFYPVNWLIQFSIRCKYLPFSHEFYINILRLLYYLPALSTISTLYNVYARLLDLICFHQGSILNLQIDVEVSVCRRLITLSSFQKKRFTTLTYYYMQICGAWNSIINISLPFENICKIPHSLCSYFMSCITNQSQLCCFDKMRKLWYGPLQHSTNQPKKW